MKKLSNEKMENVQGGAYIDCVAMIGGFAGAAVASSTGVGIAFGAISFLGAIRSGMACEGSTTWFYSRPIYNRYSGHNLTRITF